jgi:hypothetical protein
MNIDFMPSYNFITLSVHHSHQFLYCHSSSFLYYSWYLLSWLKHPETLCTYILIMYLWVLTWKHALLACCMVQQSDYISNKLFSPQPEIISHYCLGHQMLNCTFEAKASVQTISSFSWTHKLTTFPILFCS